MSKQLLALSAILALILCASLNPQASAAAAAAATVGDTSKSLGCEGLKTIEFSGSGNDFVIGQAGNPSLPWPKFIDKTYNRAIDFDAPASRIERTRNQGENPPRGGGQQPVIGDQQQTQVVAAGSPQAAALYDDLMMSLPCGFMKAAAAAKDTKTGSETVAGKKYSTITFMAMNHAATTGFVGADGMLAMVRTKIDNTVLGDIPFETDFMDYKDFSGMKFPAHIVQKQGGYPVLDLTITSVKPNGSVTIGSAPPAPPPPAAVSSEKLGEGVYFISGGYSALAVDFKDYIVVVEGPQNDQRAMAIIDESKKLIPNKPIKYVINTHHHFDHSGGLRAFVAEGATVVTQKINEPYYKKVWATPHTLVPDRLAKSPKKPTFKTVDEKLVMTGGDNVIEIYHQQNFGHNDGMLVVYLPKQKVLVEADAFNPPPRPLTRPPATISPYTMSLWDNLDRLHLDVDRIIPIHYPADNRKTTMAELRIAVGKT
jgi:glyoxylase-like metal-dependent hydrolase (beta-lactamase superfamily II)